MLSSAEETAATSPMLAIDTLVGLLNIVWFPCRGLDREHFGRFLQAWCLRGGWGLRAVSNDLIKLLEAPDYLRHAQVLQNSLS